MFHLILAAGMPRSGSTWLYNALRLMLPQPHHSAWVEDHKSDHPAAVHLVKLHREHQALARRAQKIFLSYREPLGLCASLLRMGFVTREEELPPLLDRIVADYRFWLSRAELVIDMQWILEDPVEVLQALQRQISTDLPLPARSLQDLARRLDHLHYSGPLLYDPITLLHPRHRGESGGPALSGALRRYLTEKRLVDWPPAPPPLSR